MGYLRVHIRVLSGLLGGWAKPIKPENKKQWGLVGSRKCCAYTRRGLWPSTELSQHSNELDHQSLVLTELVYAGITEMTLKKS